MTNKVWKKGLPFSAEVAPLLASMPLLDEYREPLVRLQGAWDSLTLLGQMSGAATDMADTRSAFQALTGRLLDSLARRQLHNAVQQMQGRAQVAIDILVRNLFERTADVGFLAADGPLCSLLQAHASGEPTADDAEALRHRFAAYVAKYSVYDQVALLSASGERLAALDPALCAGQVQDAGLLQALQPGQAFVELHGPSGLLGGRTGLVYASAVRGDGGVQGLLCLSFRLDDEMGGVFRALAEGVPYAVLVLKDRSGRVLQSSDPWQLPLGAPLADAGEAQGWRLAFAGRDYLSVSAQATGYEGYFGPGWTAQVLVPLAHAFPDTATDAQPEAQARQLDTRELFDEELRSIPLEARRIQHDLSRSLWNGKLKSRAHAVQQGGGGNFAVTLLNEVERTGEQLRQVFERAIAQLEHGALAAVDDTVRFQSELAISIVDRNLYERANDCRWWALDARLQQALVQDQPELAAEVLAQIHALYTVYALLLVFDAQGRVVAVSDPAQAHHVGRALQGDWVGNALALRDPGQYVVSAHAPSGLYGEDGQSPAFVYAAAIQHPAQARVAGGIAIVFDGQPQFRAMLRAALPAGQAGARALLVNRGGQVVASSDERWQAGDAAPLPASWLSGLAAGQIQGGELELDGCVQAYGLAMSGGYREYRRGAAPHEQDLAALLLLPLGPRLAANQADAAQEAFTALAPIGAEQLDVASFVVDHQWLGLPAVQVLAALERQRITAWPQAPAAVRGMLNFEGRMLPVLDLGRLLFSRPSGDDAALLVCQTSAGQRLVLAVQRLGQVFVAGAEQLQPSPTRPGWAAQAQVRLLKGQGAHMLTLLDGDDLWRLVSGVADQGLLLAG